MNVSYVFLKYLVIVGLCLLSMAYVVASASVLNALLVIGLSAALVLIPTGLARRSSSAFVIGEESHRPSLKIFGALLAACLGVLTLVFGLTDLFDQPPVNEQVGPCLRMCRLDNALSAVLTKGLASLVSAFITMLVGIFLVCIAWEVYKTK